MAIKKSDPNSSISSSCDEIRGGIPERDIDALAEYWEVLPGVRSTVFAQLVDEPVALLAGMHAAYQETLFSTPEHVRTWPEAFAIITACATTGETWSEERITTADASLESALREKTSSIHRITGYSPTTLHAEPGWAAPLTFDEACELGRRFAQDAIYYVQSGTLYVSHCDQRRQLIPIGPFEARLAKIGHGGSRGAAESRS